METKIETSFLDFQRTGNPVRLGEVFDATAADLLLAAIHLATDADSAEDLVQATFLTAIERAESFDSGRALMPWLMGILSRHAQNQRRLRSRQADPLRLKEVTPDNPLESLSREEDRQSITAAIDQLDEPYRLVVMLKLRHGMKPADIAHALQESPANIRKRLQRGIEKLKKLLPSGIAVGFLVTAPALALVREKVMAQAVLKAAMSTTASAAAAASNSSGTLGTSSSLIGLGGALVTKNTVMVGSAVFMVVLFSWFARDLLFDDKADSLESSEVLAEESDNRETKRAIGEPAVLESPAEKDELKGESTEPVKMAFGRVIDGETGQGIANARIEVHEPSKANLVDLRKRWGSLSAISKVTQKSDRLPRFVAELNDLQRVGREEVLICEPPLASSRSLNRTSTDASGDFSLDESKCSGTLVVRAQGYGERFLYVRDAKAIKVIMMWPLTPLAGVVVDTEGQRVKEPIELMFRNRELAYPLQPWVTTSKPDGTFVIKATAKSLQVESLTPGYIVVGEGHQKATNWVGASGGLLLGRKGNPARVVVQKIGCLLVRDAATKAPIEDVFLMVRGLRDGYVRKHGRFHAPSGRVDVNRFGGRMIGQGELKRNISGAQQVVIWADGFDSQTIPTFDGLENREDLVVELIRGKNSKVSGVILKDGIPLEDIQVSLIGHSRLQWREDEKKVIDATRSGEKGAFELAVPTGTYILRATHEGVLHNRVIEVPLTEGLMIDLGLLASIEVSVRDSTGKAMAKHTVVLQSKDGRGNWGETNQEGVAIFSHLPKGDFIVSLSNKSTTNSFVVDHRIEVALNEGQKKQVEVEIPAPIDSIRPILVVEGEEELVGWKAEYGVTTPFSVVDVARDGEIPINIPAEEARQISIVGPKGNRWSFPVPEDLTQGWEIRISTQGLGYAGRIVNWTGEIPLAGITVQARLRNDKQKRSFFAESDKEGNYKLVGLPEGKYFFQILQKGRRQYTGGVSGRFGMLASSLNVHIEIPPSLEPGGLDIRIPRGIGKNGELDQVKITGRVLQAGVPREDASLFITGVFPGQNYTLWMGLHQGMTRSSKGGAYEVYVPKAPEYQVNVFRLGKDGKTSTQEWRDQDRGGVLKKDIEVQ